MQTYLCPVSYIKSYSIIDENVDEKIIKTSIMDCQTMILEPIIGTELYNKLLSDTANLTLAPAYQSLLVEKIWPVLLHGTVYKVCLNLIYRLTNTSVVKDSNEVSTAISLNELNVIRQERENAIKFHQEKLILFLQNHMSDFPEYQTYDIEGLQASVVNQPRNFYANPDEYDEDLKKQYNFPL